MSTRRGLAGTVGAEERHDLAGPDGQVDVVDRDHGVAVGGSEGLAEAGGPDRGHVSWCHAPSLSAYGLASLTEVSRPPRDTCHPK